MNETFYITTPIYYASGSPHIGHVYTSICCDILARWNRQILGNKSVFFQTGTDEHGQKIVEKAKEANLEILEFVNNKSNQFLKMTKDFEITNNNFLRTTNPEHKKLVQKYLQIAFDKGDIYLGEYKGYYCVGCERYFEEKDLDENKCCLIHKKKCEKKCEKNYFFFLSKYENQLLDFYKKNPDFISPKNKQDEIINRVKEGLRDISISRNKTDLNWGIEIPFDKTHITYVWFDALFNYLTGLEINKKEEFWPANIHIVGHDISWFHLVYWPIFLMSVNKELPKKVYSHGMILDKDGHKMSKSLNNAINPYEQIEKYGLDEFKYCLISTSPMGEDLKYNEEQVIKKINNELNNDLGNLISRVHTMIHNYFNGVIPQINLVGDYEKEFISEFDNFFEKYNKHIQNFELYKAINLVFEKVRYLNAYINKVEPWKQKDKQKLSSNINLLASAIKFLIFYLKPFMPNKVKLIEKQFRFQPF